MPGLDWLISSSGYGGSGLNRPNSGQQPIYYPNGQVDSMATARAHLGRTPTAFEQMEYIDPSNLGPNQGVWDGGAGRQQEARAAGYTGAMPLRYQTGPSFQWGPNGAQRSAQDPTPGDYSGGGAAQSIARDVAYGQANGPAPMSQGNTYAMDPNAIGRNALPTMHNRGNLGQPPLQHNPWGAQGPPSQTERAQQTVAQDNIGGQRPQPFEDQPWVRPQTPQPAAPTTSRYAQQDAALPPAQPPMQAPPPQQSGYISRWNQPGVNPHSTVAGQTGPRANAGAGRPAYGGSAYDSFMANVNTAPVHTPSQPANYVPPNQTPMRMGNDMPGRQLTGRRPQLGYNQAKMYG